MFDKVSLFLKGVNGIECGNRIDEAKELYDRRTGEVSVSGYVGNMYVRGNSISVYVNGSLPKLVYGNNLYALNYNDTRRAMEKISDVLHYDMSEADVTSAEYGYNLTLGRPVEEYLRGLGEMSRAEKMINCEHGVTYRTGGNKRCVEYSFYDKKEEARRNGVIIPSGLESCNVLRYEIRKKGGVPRWICRDEVKGASLCDRSIVLPFHDKWVKGYDRIFKIGTTGINDMTDIEDIKTAGDALKFLLGYMCGQHKDDVLAFMECVKAKGNMPNKACRRFEKKIKEACGLTSKSGGGELLRELDDEIRNAGAYL